MALGPAPISTLRTGEPSVDLDTLQPHTSQYEHSFVTALPAAGMIAEAVVALVLTDALLGRVGGDDGRGAGTIRCTLGARSLPQLRNQRRSETR